MGLLPTLPEAISPSAIAWAMDPAPTKPILVSSFIFICLKYLFRYHGSLSADCCVHCEVFGCVCFCPAGLYEQKFGKRKMTDLDFNFFFKNPKYPLGNPPFCLWNHQKWFWGSKIAPLSFSQKF